MKILSSRVLTRGSLSHERILGAMKKPDLEKVKGKKIGGGGTARGNQGVALDRREQALARKRELLERARKGRTGG